MLFIVRFTDKPERAAMRQQFSQVHYDWLAEHADKVLAAGALRADVDEPPQGALWIVEAETYAAVDALLRQDPYWIHDLRESYEIAHWTKSFPARKAAI